MNQLIESTFQEYQRQRDSITRGIVKAEHIQLITEGLNLKNLSKEELSEMWKHVDEYFTEKLYFKTEDGEDQIIPYSSETSFLRDAQSAWLEVINMEGRNRT